MTTHHMGRSMITHHKGEGSGWVLRVVVRDGRVILVGIGADGGWQRIERADAVTRAWVRASRYTPPLPEGTVLP